MYLSSLSLSLSLSYLWWSLDVHLSYCNSPGASKARKLRADIDDAFATYGYHYSLSLSLSLSFKVQHCISHTCTYIYHVQIYNTILVSFTSITIFCVEQILYTYMLLLSTLLLLYFYLFIYFFLLLLLHLLSERKNGEKRSLFFDLVYKLNIWASLYITQFAFSISQWLILM